MLFIEAEILTKLQRLGDMFRGDAAAPREIRDGASDFKRTVIASC